MYPLTPHRLQQLLDSPEAHALSMSARKRLHWIAEFVMSGSSISETCERLGIARSTFHRWLDRFDPNDLTTLEERAPEAVHVRGSSMPAEVIALVRAYREQSPLMGKEKIRELLFAEHGIEASASSIGRTIERECLYFGSTPLHWRKRMQHREQQERAEKWARYDGSSTDIASMKPAHQTVQTADDTAIQPESTGISFDTNHCTCLWCRCWKAETRILRRTVVVASVLVNIAMLGMLLGTAFWEKRSIQTEASLLHSSSSALPTFASPHDGR